MNYISLQYEYQYYNISFAGTISELIVVRECCECNDTLNTQSTNKNKTGAQENVCFFAVLLTLMSRIYLGTQDENVSLAALR